MDVSMHLRGDEEVIVKRFEASINCEAFCMVMIRKPYPQGQISLIFHRGDKKALLYFANSIREQALSLYADLSGPDGPVADSCDGYKVDQEEESQSNDDEQGRAEEDRQLADDIRRF
jgi:hypothetical protein